MGDYNNDGYDDLFVTYFGQNVLYHNNGDGTFTDVTREAELLEEDAHPRWGAGCAFVDYDRDAHLDRFVSNYVQFDFAEAPKPGKPHCCPRQETPVPRVYENRRFGAAKSHVQSLMHTMSQCEARRELVEKNPIKLVRVKDGTKRLKTPRVLTADEFKSLLGLIREPFRTMVLVAGCLGLRVSEIVALKWDDFDFEALTLLVQGSIVHGRIGDVKTEHSRDSVPLDPAVAVALL